MFVNILALGVADASRARRTCGTVDRALSALLARRGADAPPRLRAAVRPSVQPDLHRFPRHPRRVMRAGGLRLFREQPPRDLRQPRLLHRQSDGVGGLFGPIWGLTACDGPGEFRAALSRAETRQFFGYAARGPIGEPDGRDDGTIAPTAALGSLPFAPEIVIPCAEALLNDHGAASSTATASSTASTRASPTRRASSRPARSIRSTAGSRRDYLGIDQGPILLQAANYRDDFVWRYMRRVPAIRRGLKRAGFTGGWLG